MVAIASEVQIVYDGSEDITSSVLYSSARFEQQMNAAPGTFEIEIKDPDLSLEFITGRRLELIVDGVVEFGGYIFGVGRTYFFPAVNTTDLAKVTRKWVLRGVDYNILLDKRVLRDPTDYLHHLPNADPGTMDGELLREALVSSKYFDVPSGFNVTTEIDDLTTPFLVGHVGEWAWPEQGTLLRTLFEDFSRLSGGIYYIAPDRKFHYKALEDVEARWGFSDRPNRGVITASPLAYQGVTIGFREGEFTRDGAAMVNDAFIWGGSEWQGSSGGTVFAREQNSDSITAHHRWQMAETHFGEEGYKLQAGVNARADVIVNGGRIEELPGGAYNPGLRWPQWQITLSWFSKDVPRISGVPDHLKAGDLITFSLFAFGEDEDSPLVITLPLRQISMDTVALNDAGEAHVKFTGQFGLQLSDPYTLWRYLLRTRTRISRTVSLADGSPAPYGTMFSGAPAEDPNGSRTVFNLPSNYGYIGTTTEVFVDGALAQRNVAYSESDPQEGQITFSTAPSGSSWIWIVCRLL